MRILLSSLLRCRRAATAVEYGLIVALIVIAMIASFRAVASQTITLWNTIDESVRTAR